MKKIAIFGGGTINDVAPHFSICSRAFGSTAKQINAILDGSAQTKLFLSRMAGGTDFSSNNELFKLISQTKDNFDIIFMTAAVCDFEPKTILQERFNSVSSINLSFIPSRKIIKTIRDNDNKSIFLVGFKTTYGATKSEMFTAGLNQIKTSSVNLTLVNDTFSHHNMIITPEEGCYEYKNRLAALYALCEMALNRSCLTFEKTNIEKGDLYQLKDCPDLFHSVMLALQSNGAFKEFNSKTSGHFGVKFSDGTILSSIRKANYYKEDFILTAVKDFGGICTNKRKSSVGDTTQREIYKKYNDVNAIVHFHAPLKPGSQILVKKQSPYECGSKECALNTADDMPLYGSNLRCVMLDKHGPNIAFHTEKSSLDGILNFINDNFLLREWTSGYSPISPSSEE